MSPADGGAEGFHQLAATARRVLGAEGVVAVARPPDERPRIVATAGLQRAEAAAVRRRLAAGGTLGGRAFDGVVSADAAIDGERLGDLHALKRGPEPFDNPDLLGSFATQLAAGLALERRPAPVDERVDRISELDRLVLSVHSFEELSGALAEVVGPLFGGAMTAVMVADSQRNVLQMIPGAFGAEGVVSASHQVSTFDPRSNSARVFSTGQPYVSNVSGGDTGIRQEYVDVFQIERLLTVPLRGVGVLHVANQPTDFVLEDVERATALAPRVASIVELATTLFRLRRQQRLEGILANVAVAVASGESARVFLAPALQELRAATDADMLAVVPDDGPPIAVRGERPPIHEDAVLEEAGGEPGMRAYVVGPRQAGDPGWAAFHVPIRLGVQRVGTLAALRERGEPFARAERHSFVRMASLAALARATERYQTQQAELARLQERQRIADDLHDDVAQILFAAQLTLDSLLARDGLDGDAATGIARARGLLIRGDTAIRTVIHRLSTPPAADLGARLAALVSSVEDEFGLRVSLHVEEPAAGAARDLDRPALDALVKVAREALVNAAKHAGPCRVGVRLAAAAGDRLLLTVVDDGAGLGPASGDHHFGLASLRRLMREQGGTLRVCEAAGKGTKVTATLPGGHAAAPIVPDGVELAEPTVASA